MKSLTARIALCVLTLALSGAPSLATAQAAGPYSSYYGYRPQYFVGGSIGTSIFPDETGTTAGWLNSTYTAATPLAPGDYIATAATQDYADFGAKAYAGAWITPNVGFEVGFASLGRIGWSAFSTNSTGSFAVGISGTVAPHAWYESLLFGVDTLGFRVFVKAGAYQASTDLEAGSFNYATGFASGGSEAVHNSGALAGLGMVSFFGRTAIRMEVEDYINVGDSSMPPTSPIPPWRGNIVLITIGAAYLF